MRFQIGLMGLVQRLTYRSPNRARRGSRLSISADRVVERLESRQLLTAGPMPAGPETLVNSSPTTGTPSSPVVATDKAGDYVVVWKGYPQGITIFGTTFIYAQRYNSSGTAQGNPIQVTSIILTNPSLPAVAMDATGDFVVTWDDSFTSTINAQRYNAAGLSVGGKIQVNSNTTHDSLSNSSVGMDASGNFVVVWDDVSSDTVMGQRLNSSGVAQGSNFQVGLTSWSSAFSVRYYAPTVAMDAAGAFAVAYSSHSGGVDVARYSTTGALQGTVEPVSGVLASVGYHARSVAIGGDGRFVVTWQRTSLIANDSDGIYAQRYDMNGITQGSAFQVESSGSFSGYNSSGIIEAPVSMDSSGDFVVAWTGQTDGSGTGVFEQFYNSAGVAQGSPVRINTFTTGDQHVPSVAMDAAGDFVAVWQSEGQNNSGPGIYSQLFVVAPTITSLNSAATYFQPSTPLVIAANLMVTGHGFNLTSATVSFTNWQNGDRVDFFNTKALQHSFVEDLNAHTATLTITGLSSASNYQTTLQTVEFWDVAGQPNTTAVRVATVTITDAFNSVSATQNITVAQYLSGLAPSVKFIPGSAPLAIASGLMVSLPSGGQLVSAKVTFTNWQDGDRLAFYNSIALQHSFAEDLVAHTATLTITGLASAAGYQALLRSVTYQTVAGNPNKSAVRTAKFTVNDGTSTFSLSENVTVGS